MAESQEYYAKWNKPNIKEYALSDPIHEILKKAKLQDRKWLLSRARVEEGDQLPRGTWKLFWVMEFFYILTVMVVTQFHTNIKIHQMAHLKISELYSIQIVP